MKKHVLYLKAATNVIVYIIALLLCIFLLPRVLVFFMPFVVGWLISLLANPVVKFFEEKIKFKRKAMSAIMIILIIALIILAGYGIIALLVNQGMGLVRSIPEKWGTWKLELNNLGGRLNDLFKNLPENTRETFANLGTSIETALSNFVSSLGGGNEFGKVVLDNLSSGIGNIANALIAVIMCVLSAYFFTAEHNTIARGMEEKLPKSLYSKMTMAYRGLKNAVGGYFKAQIQIEMFVYIITFLGLLICRVEYALVIALGIAILDFLPFFGAGLIMVPWSIVCFSNQNYFLAVGLLVTWAVGQLVRQLIQPKFVGDNVGFAPLPTLVIMFIGYRFGKVFGMIVAIPIAMIVESLYKEGVFTSFTDSVKIIWGGMTEFRRFPSQDGANDTIEEKKEEKNEENH